MLSSKTSRPFLYQIEHSRHPIGLKRLMVGARGSLAHLDSPLAGTSLPVSVSRLCSARCMSRHLVMLLSCTRALSHLRVGKILMRGRHLNKFVILAQGVNPIYCIPRNSQQSCWPNRIICDLPRVMTQPCYCIQQNHTQTPILIHAHSFALIGFSPSPWPSSTAMPTTTAISSGLPPCHPSCGYHIFTSFAKGPFRLVSRPATLASRMTA